MTICGIESLVYGVEHLELCGRFFEDWGLECIERGERSSRWALADRTTVDRRRLISGWLAVGLTSVLALLGLVMAFYLLTVR